MDTLEAIEADIYNSGAVHRNHLLAFLRLQTTSDQLTIEQAVKDWLVKLHDDPHYSKVSFAQGEIDRVLSDLHSYGHIQPDTIMEGQDPNFVPQVAPLEIPTPTPTAQQVVLGTPQIQPVETFSPETGTVVTDQQVLPTDDLGVPSTAPFPAPPEVANNPQHPQPDSQAPNLWGEVK